MNLKQKIEMSYNLIKETSQKKIWFWCGYCIVTVYNKHANVKYWQDTCMRSDLDCIDKKTGKILFLCDFYFDNGCISEFNRVYAYSFEEACREALTFSMINNLKGVLYA